MNLKIEYLTGKITSDTYTLINGTIMVIGGLAPGGLTRGVLGGKGYSLVYLSSLGLPVPKAVIFPIFALINASTPGKNREGFIKTHLLEPVVSEFLGFGQHFFSVRSGAKDSMAGMMDTVLNVGAEDPTTLDNIKAKYSDPDFLQDCKNRYKDTAGEGYAPGTNIQEQILRSCHTVLDSWDSPRAKLYRELNNLTQSSGTAVIIQQMVYGNLDQDSCTGVVFSKDPNLGSGSMVGEYLPKAQGEDVVSGHYTPFSISDLEKSNPSLFSQLETGVQHIEENYHDIVDVEFTVESGKLYFLQVRSAKRTPEAFLTYSLRKLSHYSEINAETKKDPVYVRQVQVMDVEALANMGSSKVVSDIPASFEGIPACPGAILGVCCTSLQRIREVKSQGRKAIYVARVTTPKDIDKMAEADAILTLSGGASCHAAVVARGMNKPCIVGVKNFIVPYADLPNSSPSVTICGSTGKGWIEKVEISTPDLSLREEWLSWFFGLQGVTLVDEVLDPFDVICNRLQNSESEWGLACFPLGRIESLIAAHTVLGSRLEPTTPNWFEQKYAEAGKLVLGSDYSFTGRTLPKMDSFLEYVKAKCTVKLSEEALQETDPALFEAVKDLREKVHGPEIEKETGNYLPRSKVYKALSLLKHQV